MKLRACLDIFNKIHYDIYSFTINDWKNTSLVIDEFDNKSFSLFLSDLIKYTLEKTNLFFNYEAIDILENSELELEEKNKIKKSLFKIYYDKTSFSTSEFSKKITDFLSNKYSFINSLRPQGWESFILSNNNKKINLNYYYDNISKERMNSFNGEVFNSNDNFYDNISIYITAYKKVNHNLEPFENFIESVIKYTTEVNSIEHTKKIIDRVICNPKYKEDEIYIKCINYNTYKLNFELDLENLKKKEDIKKILKKISKN